MEHYHEPQSSPRGQRKCPKVKEKEHNMNNQLSVLPGQTFSHEPDFVKLIEDDPGGIIFCTTHPLKAQVSSFPTRPVAAQLEFIWSSKQPQNRRYIFFGANPAKGRMEGDEEPSMELHQGLLDSPRSPHSAAKIKEEVQMLLNQATDSPRWTFMPRPGFVYLIANDPGGVSASTDHTLLA